MVNKYLQLQIHRYKYADHYNSPIYALFIRESAKFIQMRKYFNEPRMHDQKLHKLSLLTSNVTAILGGNWRNHIQCLE